MAQVALTVVPDLPAAPTQLVVRAASPTQLVLSWSDNSANETGFEVERQTVDLSAYPEMVVIYLGMRVRRPRGMLRLLGLGPQIQRSWRERPDGLLLHENVIWSLVPPHAGMRQYWRDLESLVQ